MERGLPHEFSGTNVAMLHQGECMVSGESSAAFTTVLGSCVATCVRDVKAKVGGMNHFLLPAAPGPDRGSFGAPARYGAFAMEELINAVLARGSGDRNNLEFKIFGGALINAALPDIGGANVAFVRGFLLAEGYRVTGEDVGGRHARRIIYRPYSGRAMARGVAGQMAPSRAAEMQVARRALQRRGGEVELFEP